MYIPTFADVEAANARIAPYIHRTGILTASFLNALTGAELFFESKNFQKAAAFKARGVCIAMFELTGAKVALGVATHSSGNCGLCLSYVAGRRSIPCTSVMPRTAPQTKKHAIAGYQGRVVECDPSTSCREAVFASVVAGTGADLSAAAVRHGTQMVCLAEIDCGARRCGVNTTTAVFALAQAIDGAAGPRFASIHACQWAMQDIEKYDDRRAKIGVAVAMVKDAVAALAGLGIACDIVGGGGTGSYYFEAASGGL